MGQFLYLLTVPFLFNMPGRAVPVFINSAFLFNMPGGTPRPRYMESSLLPYRDSYGDIIAYIVVIRIDSFSEF